MQPSSCNTFDKFEIQDTNLLTRGLSASICSLMKITLRKRFTLTIMLLTLMAVSLISVALIMLSRDDLQTLTDNNLTTLSEYAEQHTLQTMEFTANQLAESLTQPIYDGDFADIEALIRAALTNSMVNAIEVAGPDRIIRHTDKDLLDDSGRALMLSDDDWISLRNGETRITTSDSAINATAPVLRDGSLLGIVHLQANDADLLSPFRLAESEIRDTANQRVFFYSLVALSVALGLLLVTLIAADMLSRYLSQPILKLREHALSIGRGQLDGMQRVDRDDEIGDLAKAIYNMADDLEMQNQSVKFLAFHDPLTGLANRVNFQSQLEAKLQEAESNRQQLALLFIDIDDFKEINDSRGHDVGDRALRMIADRLTRVVNSVASQFDHVHVARVGGDEFTVVIGDLDNNEQAARMAEDILKRISEPVVIDEQLFNISGSIGVAIYPQDGETASSLLNNSDAAMYTSKNLGKGTYRFYEPDMNDEQYRSTVIKSEFKAALSAKDQLELRYQPLINLFTGEMVGAEALIRWHHPRLGLLPPDQFIAIVEHNEIALPTDLWVIENTIALLEKIDLKKFTNFKMSINISASNLIRKQFTSSIQASIQKKEYVVDRIKLEITETFLHSDENQAREALQALRHMGFSVWLDEFCTGYSSLNHLKTFPVEGIKIDQSFVSNLAGSPNDRKMVSALLGLAHAFSVEVIAEGIDNERSLEFLRAHGCRIGQGMLLGKPMTADELLTAIGSPSRPS